jgi:hypothetical protein
METGDDERRRGQTSMRVVTRLAKWWCAGMALAVAIAIALALFHQPKVVVTSQPQAIEGDDRCLITIEQGVGLVRITQQREHDLGWSPHRATGPPDTPSMGDITTAWASLTPDAQLEWLELSYEQPCNNATALRVYETYCPGALTRVTTYDSSGQEIELWQGVDPAAANAQGIWVATIPVAPVSFPIQRVRLYIDSPRVPGWNEIDAVGLVDASGSVTWASGATASTTYARQPSAGSQMSFDELKRVLPAWGKFRLDRTRQPATETRVVEARGWPLLTLWSEAPRPAPTVPAATTPAAIIPWRPVWTGLLSNGALYGLVLVALYGCTFGLRRFVRQSLWLRRGCCMQCGYDLRFDLAAGCPECGWRRITADA